MTYISLPGGAAMKYEKKLVWEVPGKRIRSGTDKLNRCYVVIELYTDAAKDEMHKWLYLHCGEGDGCRWAALGNTIWFDNEADRTAFLLRWQ